MVPVIAKSDSITKEELALFKKQLNKEFADNALNLYSPVGSEADAYKVTEALT